MSGILRIALTALLVGAVAMAPVSAGVPVPPVPHPELPGPADEPPTDSLDRGCRAIASAHAAATAGWLPLPAGPVAVAPHVHPPAGPFYRSVPLHLRFCVWRE